MSSAVGKDSGSSAARVFPTRESYTAALFEELTSTELGLLNFTIYYNPAHSEYYQMFHCGQFSKCWDYLMKHRGELVIANVPDKWLNQAQFSIKSAKKMGLGKKDGDNE